MKNNEIAQAFMDGEKATSPNKSFFVEVIQDVSIVFSYGQHFPIAIKFNDGFLFNNDKYSNTTARHKGYILREIESDLTDGDRITTNSIKKIVDLIKYEGVRTKAELIERKI